MGGKGLGFQIWVKGLRARGSGLRVLGFRVLVFLLRLRTSGSEF